MQGPLPPQVTTKTLPNDRQVGLQAPADSLAMRVSFIPVQTQVQRSSSGSPVRGQIDRPSKHFLLPARHDRLKSSPSTLRPQTSYNFSAVLGQVLG